MTPLPTTQEAACDSREEGCQLIQSEHPTRGLGPGDTKAWLLLPCHSHSNDDNKRAASRRGAREKEEMLGLTFWQRLLHTGF